MSDTQTTAPEVKARKWLVTFPGDRFSNEREYYDPVPVETVMADVELAAASYLLTLPPGMVYEPLDKGEPKRYVLKYSIVEVDKDGNEVEEVDMIDLLTATSDFVALRDFVDNQYGNARAWIELNGGQSASPRYPEEADGES